ncbi:polymorphic toxin-type HINT domain-containing protein [Ruminococcus sp.]|uniref:polymorphic toxin-type HINT domain-containing protein n=1 Tax=Ruminococcus sp. TaxID=41978 RepID=UPI0025FD9BD8|nr:polymorphic toxin-type HINT domain-containing protein [Ruminococcus sp.]
MFYVPGRGWVAAGDLNDGDEVYLIDGSAAYVTGAELEQLEEPIKVYNLEVDDLHTYFVGDTSILVHNQYDKAQNNSGKNSNPDSDTDTTRVRHYTNRKGINGIEESGTIIAQDNNRVYVESASKKPLSPTKAEDYYQLKPGRGRDYVEFDVPTDSLERVKNPRYGREELTILGDVLELINPVYTRRK